MPKYLWGDVVLNACYLINRLHSFVLNGQTPYVILFNHVLVPSFSNLPAHVFGVLYLSMSVKINGPNSCNSRGVNQKSYKYFYTPTQKVYVTMDVTFYEDACYFSPTNLSLQREKHTF